MENKNPVWNILYIDDDQDDYLLTQAMLFEIEKQKVNLEWAQDYQEGLDKLSGKNWDAVLVDYDLGPENGIQLIREATSNGVTAPLIMLTGRGRYEVDVQAMQAGAYDYVTKAELTPSLLERVIRYAKERQRSEKILEQRVQARTQELQTTLEELQVMEEELRSQLDETLKNQQDQEAIFVRYRNLFEFAPSAYLVTDPYGDILDANLAATILFNRQKEYLLGKPLNIFIPMMDRPAFHSKVDQLSQSDGIQEWDLRLQSPNHDMELVHVVASAVKGSKGQIITIRWLIYEMKPLDDE